MSTKAMYDAWWRRFGLETYRPDFRWFQQNWFMRRFNLEWEDWERLVKGNTVIELGTGAGAFLRTIIEGHPRLVVGIDQTEAGTAIAGKMYDDHFPNLKILRQDIRELKGYDGYFDVVVADQMLHHLPDTFEALKIAVRLVKPGGHVLFYVYLKKRVTREKADDFLRSIVTRLRMDDAVRFSEAMVWLGRFLTWLSLPLQRWLYWNLIKCFWNDMWSFDNCVRNVYDWYYVPIENRHSPDEVKGWIRDLGLKVESFNILPSGISVRATIP